MKRLSPSSLSRFISSSANPHVHLPLLSLLPPSPSPPQLVPLPSPLFNTPSRPSLLHKLVVSHLASLRAGNAATKNRSQVSYSGKKIRPQKGTGKARLGSRGSPMLKGGGHSFALTPKGPDGWSRKVNRKELQLGLRVGLSDKWRKGDLVIVDKLAWGEISTRGLGSRLKSRGWDDALFILADTATAPISVEEEVDRESFILSSGNLPLIEVVDDPNDLGIWEILKRRKIVMELSAVDQVIRRLDPENKLGVEDEVYLLNEGEEDKLADELEQALQAWDLDEDPITTSAPPSTTSTTATTAA